MAAGAIAGAAVGVLHAARAAGAYLAASEASAATIADEDAPGPAPAIVPLPRGELVVAPPAPPAPPPAPTVFGAPDAELLAPLGAAKVTRVKLNQGGTTISLRLDFANGARAAFKPEQVNLQSDPRREIAAYRLDRLLELGRVPPAKAGAVPLADVLAGIDPAVRGAVAERLRAEVIARDGVVHGELSWWIPQIKYARIGPFWAEDPDARALWVGYLQIGAQIPPAVRPLIEGMAACLVFDVLTDNADRWSGNNIVVSPDDKILYVMDNTMSFSTSRIGFEMNAGILRRVQVFPRGLVARIRALTEEKLAAALEGGGGDTRLGRLLSPQEIRAVIDRRDNLVKYIDQLIAAHGEQAVLAFP